MKGKLIFLVNYICVWLLVGLLAGWFDKLVFIHK